MLEIQNVAVFCGSRAGADPAALAAAKALGAGIAQAGLRLIYGGGRVGLMGALADAALAAGGEVVGIIPEFLRRPELAHTGLTRMQVTDNMHSRKARMFEISDVFVTLPGGLGTLDETIEILTWRQLRLHDKPILLCNVAGSAAPLVAAIDSAIASGFAGADTRRLFECLDGVEATLARLHSLKTTRGSSAALL